MATTVSTDAERLSLSASPRRASLVDHPPRRSVRILRQPLPNPLASAKTHPPPTPLPLPFAVDPATSVGTRESEYDGRSRARARAGAGLLAASVLAAVLSASAILGAPSALGSVAARLGASKDYFPFVAYLSAGDPDAEELFRSDWDEHHAGGRVGVRVVPRPRPGSREFRDLADRLDSSAAKDDEDAAAHAVQHLRAYLDARELKAQALIVADEDASISALGDGFDRAHMGRPEEFDSFLLSYLYRGPKKWDVLFCDKGLAGVDPNAAKLPAVRFTNPRWVGNYDVYRWSGGRGSGTGLHVVSGAFLRDLPTTLREQPMGASAGEWLAEMCANGHLTCYSYLERVSDARKARLGSSTSRDYISWRDTKATSVASLGSIAVGGGAGDETREILSSEGLAHALRPVGRDAVARMGKARHARESKIRQIRQIRRLRVRIEVCDRRVDVILEGEARREEGGDDFQSRQDGRVVQEEENAPRRRRDGSRGGRVGRFRRRILVEVLVQEKDAPRRYPRRHRRSSRARARARARARMISSTAWSQRRSPGLRRRSPSPGLRRRSPSPGLRRRKSSKKSSSSKSSSSKSSSSKSSSSTSPEEEDVDSLLDWWSDDVAGAGSSDAPEPARKSHSTHHRHASSRRRGSGNRTHKHKPSADDGDEDEERSSRSASSALDLALDAATDALEGAHESHSDDRRDDSDDNSRDVSSGSRASTPRDIEPSPVLDVEDEAAREEMAARAREVSEREARREKRDMARASHATDSEADAQAESRHRGGAGSIVLHTISPEEALKHVSRVHHREEVEAAEAAADLEARERRNARRRNARGWLTPRRGVRI